MAENGENPIETPVEETAPPAPPAAPAPEAPSRPSRTAAIARYLLIAGVVLAVLSPISYRTGLLDLGMALPLLPAGLLASVLAVLVGLAAIFTTRAAPGRDKALTALVGGLVVIGIVGMNVGPAMMAGAPAIHDITTDMADAPAFVALKGARDAAPNETDYAGGDTAAAQAAAFPDLAPLVTDKAGNVVFAAAEQVAAGMGWDIVASVPADGRIEATATTLIYGYKDDVVIRISPTMDGTTRVDVRSASRVGMGDLGANAARISAFLAALQAALQ